MTNEQKLQGMAKLVRIIWEQLAQQPWPGDEVTALRLMAGDDAEIAVITSEQRLQEMTRLVRSLWEQVHPERPWPDEVAALKLLTVDAEMARLNRESAYE